MIADLTLAPIVEPSFRRPHFESTRRKSPGSYHDGHGSKVCKFRRLGEELTAVWTAPAAYRNHITNRVDY